MRVIETKTHGYLDYTVSVLLMMAPWLLRFNSGGAETWLPVVLGSGSILYSLFTDYEPGLFRQLSMRTHLVMDMLSGALLAASPWLFGFAEEVWVPHVVVGIMEIFIPSITKLHPTKERAQHRRTAAAHGFRSS